MVRSDETGYSWAVSDLTKESGPDADGDRLAEDADLIPEDRALLARFRRGDRDALEVVFRHYRDPILAMVLGGFVVPGQDPPVRFVGVSPVGDAEDLLVDIFRKAFAPTARARYGGTRSFGEYLLAIARIVVIDQLRKTEQLWEPVQGAITPAPATPVSQTQGAALDRRLFDALEGDGLFAAPAAEGPKRPWWQFALWPALVGGLAAVFIATMLPSEEPRPSAPPGAQATLPGVSVRMLCVAGEDVVALKTTGPCAGSIGLTYRNVSSRSAWLRVATRNNAGKITVRKSISLLPNPDHIPIEMPTLPTASVTEVFLVLDTAPIKTAEVKSAINAKTLRPRFRRLK